MDPRSFDNFTKSVASAASGPSRRGMLKGVVGTAAAGVVARLSLRQADAQAAPTAQAAQTCRELGQSCIAGGPLSTGCCAGLACLRTINDTGTCVQNPGSNPQCPAGFRACGPAACCTPGATCVTPGTCRVGS